MKSPFELSRKLIRKRLLEAIRGEKERHWKMRGSHKLGKHFERGFYRGLNHADQTIRAALSPKGVLGNPAWQEMLRKQREADIKTTNHHRD